MFLAGFIGWVWDAFDFFSVTMTVTELASTFNVSTASVTWVSRSTDLGILAMLTSFWAGDHRYVDASIRGRFFLWLPSRSVWEEIRHDSQPFPLRCP